jgi:hypothetical protein
MATMLVNPYVGGDWSDGSIPMSAVIEENFTLTGVGFSVVYAPGSTAKQMNHALVDIAIIRAAELNFQLNENDIIYTAFARGK